ncbi:pirin family protein [Phytohabitans kaempferiae]|uniref:Pirin family protein n=1 Tax=Phytohabitans kaempferiae TaxID=1620943 RepID=A0ABV6M040_9ACTN
MLTIRREIDIFEKDGGWYQARWHFSFDHYRDEDQMGVGALRVFNDDRIIGGASWPMHPHRDLESLTYVVEGEFDHADSLGNGGRLGPGGAQVMDFSHGGALHSERNASHREPLRFLQFWILPSDPVLPTHVQQRQFDPGARTNIWLQIMGPPGEDGLDLAQDARVHVTRLTAGRGLTYTFGDDRGGYVYLIDGSGTFDGRAVSARDAGKVVGPHDLVIESGTDSDIIVVDVPMRFRRIGVWAER